MPSSSQSLPSEIASLALIAIAGVLLLVGAAQLPGPEFDPLGPAGMPRYVGYLIIALVLLRVVILYRATGARGRNETLPAKASGEIGRTVSAALIVLAYLGVLTVGGVSFPILSMVFLVLFGLAITHWSLTRLPIIAAVAVVGSFGLSYVFTELLSVMLPD